MEITQTTMAVYRLKILFVVVLLASLSACSLHYTDKNGYERYLGLVSLKIKQQDCVMMVNAKSAGLTVDLSKLSGGVNLGVRNTTRVFIVESGEQSITTEGVDVVAVNFTSQSSDQLAPCPLNFYQDNS